MNPKISDGGRSFLEQCARQGGQVTDGPVNDGWGVLPFLGKKAHRWTVEKRDDGSGATLLRSACGLQDYATRSVPLLGVGSFERCRRCESALMRRQPPNVAHEARP